MTRAERCRLVALKKAEKKLITQKQAAEIASGLRARRAIHEVSSSASKNPMGT